MEPVNCQFASCRHKGVLAAVLVTYDDHVDRPLCFDHASAVKRNRAGLGVTFKTLDESPENDPEGEQW